MFGIGGGEIVFIILVILMLFGSDKIPEIARTLGKIMAQLKNATNDIKSEIHKGVEAMAWIPQSKTLKAILPISVRASPKIFKKPKPRWKRKRSRLLRALRKK